jgi:hypothetical protein
VRELGRYTGFVVTRIKPASVRGQTPQFAFPED